MNSNGILHLTVNGAGQLSLWDSPADAREGKKPGDVQLSISLTQPQMAVVLRAENMAAAAARPKHQQ